MKHRPSIPRHEHLLRALMVLACLVAVGWSGQTEAQTYTQNFSQSQSSPNQCTAWNAFRGTINSNTVYGSIRLRGSRNEPGFTCTGAEADNMCQRIRANNMSNFQVTCGGNTWRIGQCGGGMEVSVGQGGTNPGICGCPSSNVGIVRPCIGNSNWGGFNGATCGGSTQRMDVICTPSGPNSEPVIEDIANRTDDEDEVISLQVNATDGNDDPLEYSANILPDGLAINATTGLISGTIGSQASRNSPYNVIITVDDGRDEVTETFTWTINNTNPSTGVQYSEDFSQNSSSGAQCTAWGEFQSEISANSNYDVVTLRGSRNEPGFSCTGSSANNICQRIRTNNTGNFQVTCDGNTWRIGNCGSGQEVSVGQGGTNPGICGCPSSNVGIVRPCIGNSNWGGFNGATCGGSTQRMDVVCGNLGPNEAPEIQAIANQTSDENTIISLQVNATDDDDDELSYEAEDLPDGLTINEDTGLISGVISAFAADDSPYNVVITVGDGREEVTESFTWTVNDTININRVQYSEDFNQSQSSPNQCTEWNQFQGRLTSNATYGRVTIKGSRNEPGFVCTGAQANDICQRIRSNNMTNFQATCDGNTWRIGQCGSGMEVSAGQGGTNPGICGCPSSNVGIVRPCIGNSNWGGFNGATCGGSNQRMDVICEEDGPNFAPVIQDIANQENDEDEVVSLQVSASDPNLDTLEYSANILPDGLAINATTGLISGTIGAQAARNSPYNVIITVDDGRDETTEAFTWVVNNTNPQTGTAYSEDFNQSQSSPNQCTEWRSFQGRLTSNQVYDVVTLKGSRNEPGFSCTGSSANDICQRIRTNNTGNFQVTCDGNTWRIGNCGSGQEVSVGQGGTNPGICGCPSSNVGIVRPCIGNSNWGGFNGATCGGSSQRMDVICGNLGPNEAPDVEAIADRTDDENEVISLQVNATDDDDDDLTYTATNLPDGITINEDTGLISGVTTAFAADDSPYAVVVTVTDGREPINRSFTWTINDTVDVARVQYSEDFNQSQSSPNQCTEWRSFQGRLTSNTTYGRVTLKGSRNEPGFTCTGAQANDICQRIRSNNVTNFQATCDGNTWRIGNCGSGQEVSVGQGGTNPGICGCPSSNVGIVRPCIGNSNWGGFNGATCGGSNQRMDVLCEENGPNFAPVMVDIANRTNDEDDVISLQVQAADANNDVLEYTANTLPDGLILNEDTGLITGTIGPQASQNSPYAVTITVSDGRDEDTTSFVWIINNTNPQTGVIYSENFTQSQDGQAPQCDPEWTNFRNSLSANTSYGSVTIRGSNNETGFTCNGPAADEICQRVRRDDRSNFSVTCDGQNWNVGGCGAGVSVSVGTSVCSCSGGNNIGIVRPCIGNGNSNWGGFGGNSTCNAPSQRLDLICGNVTPNEAPTLQQIADQENDEGDTVSIQAVGNDDDDDTLTYSATGLPDGVTINATTGLISGTIDAQASEDSPLSTRITVTDGREPFSIIFEWTVNDTIQVVNVQYSEDFNQSQSSPNQCTEWGAFQGRLSSNNNYTSVVMQGSRNERGFECTGPQANDICQRIRSNNLSNFVATCNGNTWRIGSCGNGQEVSVGQGGTNPGICGCPSSNVGIVRPCIGNSNWGGFDGATCGGSSQRMDVICRFGGTNEAPEVDEVADQENDEGDTVSLQIEADDPDDNALSYEAEDLPEGLTINEDTGLISGTISGSAGEDGPYDVLIIVSDGNLETEIEFEWVVNDTIQFTTVIYSEDFTRGQDGQDPQCNEWDAFQGRLDSGATYNKVTLQGSRNEDGFECEGPQANDICQRIRSDNRTLFTVSCGGNTWRVGGCGSGQEVNVARGNNNAGMCSCSTGDIGIVRPCINPGNPNWGGFDGATCSGPSQRLDVICHTTGGNNNGNSEPVIADIDDQTDDEGKPVSLQVIATDGDGDDLTFEADGLPLGLTIDENTGLITGTISHAASEDSPFEVTIRVDDGTDTTEITFEWVTTDIPVNSVKVLVATPNVTGHGQPTAQLLTDQSFRDITATAVDSDTLTLAQLQAHQVVLVFTNSAPSNAGPLGDLLAAYVDSGGSVVEASYGQNSTVFDIEGRWNSGNYSIVNRNNNNINSTGTMGTRHQPTHPILSGVNALTVTQGRTGVTTLKTGGQRVADYNDGQLLTGVREDKNGRIAWVGLYPQNGYSGDALRLMVNALFWTAGQGLDAENTEPVVNNPGAQFGVENQTISIQIVANDVNGDDLTFTADGLPPGLTIDEDTGVISGTISGNAGDNSPYSVTITVDDGTDEVEISFSWSISDTFIDPVITFNAPGQVWLGQETTVTGTIQDPGCNTAPNVTSVPDLGFTVTGGSGNFTITATGVGEGLYNPVSVTAVSGCSGRDTNGSRTFGVDTSKATVTYLPLGQNGVDENDSDTWPIVGEFNDISMLMQLRDNQSGLESLTVNIVNVDTNESVTIHQSTFDTPGTPPTGPSLQNLDACNVDEFCNGGDLQARTLEGFEFRMEIIATNGAGSTTNEVRFFRRFGLVEAIIAMSDAMDDNLDTNVGPAEDQLDTAFIFIEVAISSGQAEQWGSVALALQVVDAALRAAKLFDPALDLDAISDESDLVGELFIGFLDTMSTDVRDDGGNEGLLDIADDFITQARGVDDLGTILNFLANAFFFIEDAPDPMLANNFRDTFELLDRILEEMEDYIDFNPELVGRDNIIDAADELFEVLELIERVVDNGDESLSDLEHAILLLGLTNTAEALKEAQSEATWVRNWQWGLTQIVYIYSERGLNNATTFLGNGNAVIQLGFDRLEQADEFREDRRADPFMELLIDSRCLVISIYNFAYEPDLRPPLECCEDMFDFRDLDPRFPVHPVCRP